ncbi:unnamed protein product [Ectocarpus sp. CCAP 1310/34]|nr:unnamed protein product [Ectocarpus sp. CCAP 1310/34]
MGRTHRKRCAHRGEHATSAYTS